MKNETIAEYLARGGKITKCPKPRYVQAKTSRYKIRDARPEYETKQEMQYIRALRKFLTERGLK